MSLWPYSLGGISCVLIMCLMALAPGSHISSKHTQRPVHLAIMSYGKKISIDQSICVVTVDRQRRWFIDQQEITSLEMLHAQLNKARAQQRKKSRRAYVRCRIDQRCPARDFLDFFAAAKECGFDGIMVAGIFR